MSNSVERDTSTEWALSPLAGLVPSRLTEPADAASATRAHGALGRNLMSTMPIVLVGSLALSTLGIGGTLAATPKPAHDPKSDTSDLTKAVRDAVASAAARSSKPVATFAPAVELTTAAVTVPAHYTVKHGDTISEIAGHFHLSTASVLALNGLGWKSLIFPGQVLKLKKTSVAKPPAPSKPAPPVATPPANTPPTSATSYTIKSGDTITSIAKKFGVTVAAILGANNLTASSVIYAGRTLIIPGSGVGSGSGSAGSTSPAQVGGVVTPLSPAMKTNALTIIAVGKQRSVPDFGIIVALAAAAQESGLQNVTSGDKDSLGLFQQRPSSGWGTKAQLLDTTYASELFYGGPSNPNKGNTRGLLDIKGWQSMTLTQAAQAVEISGHPNAYAKWETSARAWFAQLG